MGQTTDEYIQLSKVCVRKWVFPFSHTVCVHALHCACVWCVSAGARSLNDEHAGYHKVTTSLALHVCVWDRVCVWHWGEGCLMRALIKKQTVYWINPVVINRPQNSQPPALCVPPSALMSRWRCCCSFGLIDQVLVYSSVLIGTLPTLLQHTGLLHVINSQSPDIISCLAGSSWDWISFKTGFLGLLFIF